MESLTPKDLDMLAHLLKPIMLAQNQGQEELEEYALPTMTSASDDDKKDDTEWHNPTEYVQLKGIICTINAKDLSLHISSVRNGHCDPFYNFPELKMDGGDCCESTCASTSQYVCGAEENGYVSTGYYYCNQPKDVWQSTLLNGDAGSYSGYAVDLSRGSLAVSELLQDRVRIYDKVGSSWVLRDTILGSPNTRFGTGVLGLSSGPFNVASNPSFRAPLPVAVQDGYRTLRIYRCNFHGCTLSQEIPLVYDFALSDDGTVVATSLFVSGQAPKAIRVYEAQEGLFEFRADLNGTRNGTLADVHSLSLSGDGSRIAVQSQVKVIHPITNFPVVIDEYIVVMAWDELTGDYDVETEFRFESHVNNIHMSMSLAWSRDGNVLGYGLPVCSDRQLHIQALNDEGEWVPRASPTTNITDCIDSERPYVNNALSLSGDGSMIAFRVGTLVRVFEWQSEAESWNDDNVTGAILFEQETYPEEYAFATIVEEGCIPADSCYVFTMYNREERGMQAPGQFGLFMDGEKVVHGSFDGLFVKEYFGNCLSCPAGTERLSIMMLACEQIPWALGKFIEAKNDTDSSSSNSSSDSEDELEVPPLCSEYFNAEDCPNWISYETCLDPTECYAFQFLSNLQALVENVFGEQTEKPSSQVVCGMYTTAVGNAEKCWTENATTVHFQNDTLAKNSTY
ncbi:expressed unknown protein [Seminavis robusta]|uniref:Uncharacterized protein n=1 Tax=Seminavis robusta TaxID=568900 RepID=A0A9N8HMN4_9STRA|nr:expressed unknown protein [Seminavis robusta]|eukprot:Sro914_g219580.1 n/a (680) ;mRNA; f:19668-21916